MRAALAAAVCSLAACAHTALEEAPVATAPLGERRAFYEAHRPAGEPPAGALFFSAPLRLNGGARAEPADLLAAVDADSATADAVRRFQLDRAAFLSLFAAGAVCQVASTASTVVGVPLLATDAKSGTAVLIAGRVVEVAGFGALAAGYFLFGAPSIEAREEAFRTYDASLRARLGLFSSGSEGYPPPR